jgi:hypothetical protein
MIAREDRFTRCSTARARVVTPGHLFLSNTQRPKVVAARCLQGRRQRRHSESKWQAAGVGVGWLDAGMNSSWWRVEIDEKDGARASAINGK